MKQIILASLILTGLLLSCSNNKSTQLEGTWDVQWITDSASYPDVDTSMNFTMNGKFTFDDNGKLTIDAYGYEYCIFGSDTLSHTLNWKIENDTLLSTYNDKDLHGISYHITKLSDNKVELQMMEDILLHLTRK